jgi:hypothetical protein
MLYKPSWLSQFTSLTAKTFRVLKGRPLLLISSLLLPAIGFLLVVGIQKGLDNLQSSNEIVASNLFKNPVSLSGNPLPKETVIYYAPNSAANSGIFYHYIKKSTNHTSIKNN